MKTKLKLSVALALFVAGFCSLAFAQAAPIAQSVPVGQPVQIKFVSASGTAPFTYQWQKNGTDIAGATGANLVFGAVAFTDVGTYTLKVTNSAGNAISNPAAITVTAIAPGNVIISFQPVP